MFLENASQKGWIEVICGSMFSGKTEELIRRLRRAQFANLRVEIFKPCVDTRYSDEEVVSHDAHAIRSTPVESAQNILLLTSDVDVVGIDEAQFFDEGIVDVCRALADSGVRVIAAMSAEGRSTIQNIDQIDRGYCNIDGRLNALGARITRCEECG